MRAIDADALRKNMKFICMGVMAGTENFNAPLLEIDNAPTIQPEPHWIPVTERLPEKDGNYLVSGKWGSGKESVGDCEFSVEDGYFRTAWNFDVLAWCELPEPYKGVTE